MCRIREAQFLREAAAEPLRELLGLGVEHLDADRQMTKELSFVGVAERRIPRQFADLADVVQERPHEEQVRIDLGVEVRNPDDRFQEVGDVFQQPAAVGVVQPDPGRRWESGSVIAGSSRKQAIRPRRSDCGMASRISLKPWPAAGRCPGLSSGRSRIAGGPLRRRNRSSSG